MAERVLVVALIIGIGIVAYDELARQNQFPPRPYRFVGVALIYSVLAILAVPAPALAAAFGVATDIGLIVRRSGQGQPASAGSGQAAGFGSTLGSVAAQIPALRGSSQVNA